MTKTVTTIVAAFLLALFAQGAERKPNILFILVDDQAPFDLKQYNPKSTLESPSLDRLASEGMVLDGTHQMGSFSGAVCTPSRHMIMSGRTVWRLPVGPGAKKCPPDLEKNTIGAVFNQAGYATMRTCKRGNSYPAANKQFSVLHEAVKRGNTDESGSAWHAERVLDYLKERQDKKDGRPFFIYFGLSHPHDERDGKPELLAKYGATNHTDPSSLPPANPKQPPLPPNWLPAHPFDNTHSDVRDEVAVSGVWKHRDATTIRNELGREYACVENIDIQIGRVLGKLAEMGELENTYIFYTADNGISIGRHGLMGKQNLYEHAWRLPMIIKGPGIKPNSRALGNIYLGDLLATFCDLTGVKVPETNEGTSFKPVLLGEKKTVRETLYGAYNGGEKPGMRCVKQGDWKLIQYESKASGTREIQLFNLKDNPDELLAEHHDPKVTAITGVVPAENQINLAKDPKYAQKLAEMQALLLAEMRRLEDPWRFWNQPSDGLTAPGSQRPTLPNIVLIYVDDLGYGDLGCYGSKTNDTPYIDRLAKEGMRFTDYYSASPVCTPSRAALLTGCYPGRVSFDVFGKKKDAWVLFPGYAEGLNPAERLLPELLKEKGYATCHIGKWHLGDQPEHLPTRHGFDSYYGLPYSNDMGIAGKRSHYPPLPLLRNETVIQQQPTQAALIERYTEEAVSFIRANRDKPFFLYLAHLHVHLPHYVMEPFIANSRNGRYGAAVAAVDWSTGVLMAELKRLGIAENTIVIFTSDNGSRARGEGGSNAPLRGNKGQTWEGGMRVPCIVKWPGHVPAGQASPALVTAMDFYPTLASLVGHDLSTLPKHDGMNLLSVWRGEKNAGATRDYFFYFKRNELQAVRSGKWKLRHAFDVDKNADPNTLLLYDLSEDSGETRDLSAQHPDVVKRLSEAMGRIRAELGDTRLGITGAERRPPAISPNPKPLTAIDPDYPDIEPVYKLNQGG